MMGYQKNSLTDILATSTTLSQIVKKVDQLAKLNRAVLKKLDPTLAQQCRVANLRDGVLILTTSSPIWGHQLRFSEIELLSSLRSVPEWCALKSIKTHIQPVDYTHPTPFRLHPKPTLSKLGASHIEHVAQDIENQGLKQALLRLSKRGSSAVVTLSQDTDK